MCRGGGDELGLREGGGVAALGHGAVGGGHGGRVLAEPVGGGPDERVDHVAGRGGVAGHGARKTDVGVARLGGHRGFADRKSTRLNSSNQCASRMPSSSIKK